MLEKTQMSKVGDKKGKICFQIEFQNWNPGLKERYLFNTINNFAHLSVKLMLLQP